ncbi:MAG TPA: N-acetylmuramoyl-L-alanine amidase [Herpetosiphonaceae bacterium]
MPRIALSAGHRNQTGGNPIEMELVGPITHELAESCRDHGFDVRVVTPDDGVGTFPGGLREVAKQVVQWADQGWRADIFLEVHAESNGSGDLGRGCFAIYPAADGDTDVIVRDRLGPMIVRALRDETTIPLRGSGVLSERQTHVWTKHNARLGIFEVTRRLQVHCHRLIVEVGAYSSPADLRVMQRPDFAARAGRAMAEAIAQFHDRPLHQELRWYRVAVDTARTREGPGTRFRIALQGEALMHRDQVFAGDEVVEGEPVNGNPLWVHRADHIGFISMALLEKAA